MQKQVQYHSAIDGLRVLAILAVTLIHTSTRTIEAIQGQIDQVPFAFFLNQASRFAVPLFFMISGYVLEVNYPFHQSYTKYLKKRLSKIFLPYVFWSAIYYLFIYREHSVSFLTALFGGNASYQLYFIPTLLIFYFIFPLLHSIYSQLSNKFVLLGMVVLQFYLLTRDYYFHPLPIFYPIDIALLNYLVFIIGMIASHHKIKLHKWISSVKYLLIIVITGLSLLIAIQARSLYQTTHNYLDYYSSWRPNILIYTFLFAGLFYELLEHVPQLEKITQTFSRLSFFVFFIHVAVLEAFWTILGKTLFSYSDHTVIEKVLFDVIFFLSVSGVSYAIAYIAHKIPQLQKITG